MTWLLASTLLALLTAAPASGAELISIPVDEIIFGREGEEILVASADVPPELVGQSCEMTGETVNQESVHLGNDLLIRLGDRTEELDNFEDERDIRYTFSSIADLPPRIEVYVRLGPDGVSSGGFLISIQCEDDSTTTTTTTSSSTTTTTTGGTAGTTTTTVPGSASTTSSGPTSSLATTTLAPTSTTIQIAGPSTTSLPPGGTTSVTTPNQLAVTGTEVIALTWLGLALAALGVLALAQAGRLRTQD